MMHFLILHRVAALSECIKITLKVQP